MELQELHGIAWYCMVLHGIAWYCMVLHGSAWYCMVLHGIAWYCMVLHFIAWYCTILHYLSLFCTILELSLSLLVTTVWTLKASTCGSQLKQVRADSFNHGDHGRGMHEQFRVFPFICNSFY